MGAQFVTEAQKGAQNHFFLYWWVNIRCANAHPYALGSATPCIVKIVHISSRIIVQNQLLLKEIEKANNFLTLFSLQIMLISATEKQT